MPWNCSFDIRANERPWKELWVWERTYRHTDMLTLWLNQPRGRFIKHLFVLIQCYFRLSSYSNSDNHSFNSGISGTEFGWVLKYLFFIESAAPRYNLFTQAALPGKFLICQLFRLLWARWHWAGDKRQVTVQKWSQVTSRSVRRNRLRSGLRNHRTLARLG